MYYNRKKRLVQELSKLFENVSVTDRKGNIFYSDGNKVRVRKTTDENELLKIEHKFANNKNEMKFRCFEEKLSQKISKIIYLGREPVLVKMNLSADKTFFDGKEATNSALKVVIDHDSRLYTDMLTGVYNRIYMADFLGDKNVKAVAMVDVDDFKKINDTYGHIVGDIVLKNIAKIIMLCVAEFGKVIRFGGDEFVIVFEKIEKDNLQTILKEISRQIGNFTMKDFEEKASVSIGAVYGNGNVDDFLCRADKAMYELKKRKK